MIRFSAGALNEIAAAATEAGSGKKKKKKKKKKGNNGDEDRPAGEEASGKTIHPLKKKGNNGYVSIYVQYYPGIIYFLIVSFRPHGLALEAYSATMDVRCYALSECRIANIVTWCRIAMLRIQHSVI